MSFNISNSFFGIGSPKNGATVDSYFKFSNIFSKLGHNFGIGSYDYVVNSVGLIGSYEFLGEGGFHGFHLFELRFELVKESGFKDLCSFTGLVDV